MASEISLLSDDDVDKIAAFDISSTHDLYDPRFGSAGSVELECPTCGMKGEVCMGHHASLSLGTHMFHPLAYKKAEEALNNTCFKCAKPLPAVALNVRSSSGLLPRQGSIGLQSLKQPTVATSKTPVEVLKHKLRKCKNCGSHSYGGFSISITNLDYATRKNSSMPLAARDVPEGVLPKGYIISKILVPPIHFRNTEDMEWSSDIHKMYEQLIHLVAGRTKGSMTVSAMYTKIVGAAKKEGIIGILSGKDGIFRKLMLGKRVESCARAVIVGDPNIGLDEIAIPTSISSSIKIGVYCTKFNIQHMKQLATKNALWWEATEDLVDISNVVPGMMYERHLQDGDLMLFNRQPSLSRYSLMCFKARLRHDEYNVFGMNPQVTAPFNADFDGDEMNAFFMENRAEMIELCHLSKCVVDHDHNVAIVVPVQDVVTGCYMMSLNDEPVSDNIWADCVLLSGTDYADKDSKKTTKSLLYMCIPGYDGKTLNKKKLTEYVRNVDPIGLRAQGKGGQLALDMLQKLQLVIQRWISARGLTVPLASVVATPITINEGESIDAFKERCNIHVERELFGTDIMSIIQSGAKGSVTHASHMAVAIGQQYIRGRKGTFCKRSYSQGLTPEEFYGHQMAAREGVVSTGVGTASTGYLNRRSCKILADLKMQYNGTIADEYGVSTF